MPVEQRANLKVEEQLERNLRQSKGSSGKRELNHAEIDETFVRLNKFAVGPSGKGDLELNASESLRFSYRLLKPLEATYTANTGETFTYEAKVEIISPLGSQRLDIMGRYSPEDCIKWAVKWAAAFGVRIPS